MAHIARYPLVRHFRGTPTRFVVHLRRGTVAHQGTGQAFFYRSGISALSEVPVDDRELTTVFHASTADFQDAAVQLTVTYRFTDPVMAASRLDFGVDPDRGVASPQGLEQVQHIITQVAQSAATTSIVELPLTTVLAVGIATVTEAVREAFAGHRRVQELGVSVLGAQVLAVNAEPDVRRALETPLREALQAEADKATYERRALAVERERAIAQNELATRLELATRTESLLAQEGANAKRQAEDAAAAQAIESRAAAERTEIAARATATGIEVRGAAEAAATGALMRAHSQAGEGVLLALALREAAANLPHIEAVTITPDMVSQLLARLGGKAV